MCLIYAQKSYNVRVRWCRFPQMFDLVDVEYARWVRENTPSHAVFMVPTEHYPRHFRVVR